MAELKTQPTRRSPRAFLGKVQHAGRREDALQLLELFEKLTEKKAVMWGDSIIGFGRYHYRQRNGQQASWPVTGFSPRKQNLAIYIMPGFKRYETLLEQLGKHRHSVSCLYINRLHDIDRQVLATLVKRSVADMGEIYRCD